VRVLSGILSESREYYEDMKQKLEDRISRLPKGAVRSKIVKSKYYYYIQERIGGKVVHNYISADDAPEIQRQVQERRDLGRQLKEVREALSMLKRAEGRKADGRSAR
jgi:hypothetical protein